MDKIMKIKDFFDVKEKKSNILEQSFLSPKEKEELILENLSNIMNKKVIKEEIVSNPVVKKKSNEDIKEEIVFNSIVKKKSNEDINENTLTSFISNSVSTLKKIGKHKDNPQKHNLDEVDILDRDTLLNVLKVLQNDLSLAKRNSSKIGGGMGGGGGSVDERHKIYDENKKLINVSNLRFNGFTIIEDKDNDVVIINNIGGGSVIEQPAISLTIKKDEIEEIDVIDLTSFKTLKYMIYMECDDRKRSLELSVLNKGDDSLIHSVFNILGDDIEYKMLVDVSVGQMFLVLENKDVNDITFECKKVML